MSTVAILYRYTIGLNAEIPCIVDDRGIIHLHLSTVQYMFKRLNNPLKNLAVEYLVEGYTGWQKMINVDIVLGSFAGIRLPSPAALTARLTIKWKHYMRSLNPAPLSDDDIEKRTRFQLTDKVSVKPHNSPYPPLILPDCLVNAGISPRSTLRKRSQLPRPSKRARTAAMSPDWAAECVMKNVLVL